MKACIGDHLDLAGLRMREVNIAAERLLDRGRAGRRDPAARTVVRFVIGRYREREQERDYSKSGAQLH